MDSLVILITNIRDSKRTISKNGLHRTTYIQRRDDERNKMARGGNEMRRKSEASEEIWKRGYN
jgi:hypothetical protein